MRRRLTLTIVGVVAAALVVAGLGTLLLARAAAREETRVELVEQARALAGLAEGLDRRPVLAALRRSLRLEGAELVPLAGPVTAGPGRRGGAGDRSPHRGPLAAGPVRDATDLDPGEVELLQGGAAVSGWRGDVAYAAAPVVRGGQPVAAVVLTRGQPSGLGTALPWFLVSASLALVVAAVAADRLARRFARPVIAAEQAARRIAAGDLDVRVEPGGPGAEAELARLAASINSMAADLQRAQGLQRQFLLSVSHELRTPLTSVRGFAEAIADGAAPDTRRAAEVIGAEARRLERLVGDLLDLAKLDARRFSLDLRPVDVGEVVSVTAEGFRPAAAAAGVALEVDTGEAGDAGDAGHAEAGSGRRRLVAAADPERLAQVVANLVENALNFASSRIVVSAAHESRLGESDPAVVVSVSDDGPGMAKDDLPHVFDRLFQSSRPPARSVGSGLGLAIVAELAAAMGARVAAESRPGATRMVVRLGATGGGSSSRPSADGSWRSSAGGSSPSSASGSSRSSGP